MNAILNRFRKVLKPDPGAGSEREMYLQEVTGISA